MKGTLTLCNFESSQIGRWRNTREILLVFSLVFLRICSSVYLFKIYFENLNILERRSRKRKRFKKEWVENLLNKFDTTPFMNLKEVCWSWS